MKVNFKTISGNIYTKKFGSGDTVQDAIKFLMGKMTINDDKLFLVSHKMNQFFYVANEKLEQIGHKNFAFLNLYDISNEQSMPKSKMAIPSTNILSTINFLKNKKIGSEERKIYFQYSSILRKEPKDLQSRIDQLIQLGYDQNDCLEALRQNNYNVNEAAQYITHIFSSSFYLKPKTKSYNPNKKYNRNKREEFPIDTNHPIFARNKESPSVNSQKQQTCISHQKKSIPSQESDQIGNLKIKQSRFTKNISPPRKNLLKRELPTRNIPPPIQRNKMQIQTDDNHAHKNTTLAKKKNVKFPNQKMTDQNRPKSSLF